MSPRSGERTAYHEAGHALRRHAHAGRRPRRARSRSSRAARRWASRSPTPEGDRYGYSRDELHRQDQGRARRPGGRAGRLRRASPPAPSPTSSRSTKLARGMVAPLGHERRGSARSFRSARAARTAARCSRAPPTASPATQQTVDDETRRIVESAEAEVIDTARARTPASRRARRTHCSTHETLDQDEAYRVAGVGVPEAQHNGKRDIPARQDNLR